jgi:CubicO group peptidase (beta-lactamase class C family)
MSLTALALLAAAAAQEALEADDAGAEEVGAEAPAELAAHPRGCPARSVWPGSDWERAPAGDADAISALEAYAFPAGDGDEGDLYGADRAGVRTDGVVIVKGGRVIYERYNRGYDASTPHLAWSVTKSYISALTGRAVELGELSIEASICDHLDLPRQESCAITPRHMLTFTSGLDWRETYENDPPTTSSVVAMLYGQGPADAVGFIADHPLRAEPGAQYSYSSGDTTLLSGVFDPIGVTSATLERDRKGVLIGSSYLYSTPLDMARFGYLYLNDGCWEGERLLPEGWVADSVTPSDATLNNALGGDPDDISGYSWWLNVATPRLDGGRPWPDAPADLYAALGHWKQSISVVPSEDLVIVRTGDDRDGSFDFNRFLKLAITLADTVSSEEG